MVKTRARTVGMRLPLILKQGSFRQPSPTTQVEPGLWLASFLMKGCIIFDDARSLLQDLDGIRPTSGWIEKLSTQEYARVWSATPPAVVSTRR